MVPHFRFCLRRVCGHWRIWLACVFYRQTASNLGSSNFQKLRHFEQSAAQPMFFGNACFLINSAGFPTSIPVHSNRRHSFKPASPSVTPFRSHRTSFPSRPEELKRSVLVYPAGPRACKDLKWREKTCRLDLMTALLKFQSKLQPVYASRLHYRTCQLFIWVHGHSSPASQ
jgi:hypothetical protein